MTGDLHDLVGAYATDALAAPERAGFEAHLQDCPDCAAELAGYREALGALAAAHAVLPPASLEQAVLAAAGSRPGSLAAGGPIEPGSAPGPHAPPPDTPAVATPGPSRLPRLTALAAASAALFLAGALVGRGTAPSEPPLATTDASVAETVLAVTSAPDAALLPLEVMGTDSRVVVSDEMGKAVLLATDLPTPAKGMCYQVWAVAPDGTKSSAGVFLPDAQGHVAAVLRLDPEVRTYVITTEPPGGSKEPTGQMVGQVGT